MSLAAVLIIATFFLGPIGVAVGYVHLQRRRRRAALARLPKGEDGRPTIGGYPIMAGRRLEVGRTGDPRVRAAVEGVLPTVIEFTWMPGDRHPRRRRVRSPTHVWLEILFGNPFPVALPPHSVLKARAGDLICDVRPPYLSDATEAVVTLAKIYTQRRPDDLVDTLHEYATTPSPRVRACALELLLEHFPKHENTRQAIASAVDSGSPVLEMMAIDSDEYEDARSAIVRIASGRASALARARAIEHMLAASDLDALLEVTKHPVPSLVSVKYVRALRAVRDPRVEMIALHYLTTRARRAAAVLLAERAGTRTLLRLRNLLDRRHPKKTRRVLETLIDDISDRLQAEGRAGGLALVESPGGDLSTVERDGALSHPADEPAPS